MENVRRASTSFDAWPARVREASGTARRARAKVAHSFANKRHASNKRGTRAVARAIAPEVRVMHDAPHRPARHRESGLPYRSLFLSREISFFTSSSARRTHINCAMHVREIAPGAPPFTFVARSSLFYRGWGKRAAGLRRVRSSTCRECLLFLYLSVHLSIHLPIHLFAQLSVSVLTRTRRRGHADKEDCPARRAFLLQDLDALGAPAK